MRIDGNTELIAHIGFPTHAFKLPLVYNPWFEANAINALVVPMGCQAEFYAAFLRALFKLENIRGALITMPHKVSTVALVDELLPAARIAGACNAVRRLSDGRLQGDMFDGEGFVRGVRRKGLKLEGARALVVGCGGVGSAIAAALAGAGLAAIGLFDQHAPSSEGLGQRLKAHYPSLEVATGSNDPAGYALVVNATPMGMQEDDPLPLDVSRIAPDAFVGEVVMKTDMTPLLAAAQARGNRVQIGSDMLFEQIPAYLEYFGFPSTTPEQLRSVVSLDRRAASAGPRPRDPRYHTVG
jgi:shikimate dehydrogenase